MATSIEDRVEKISLGTMQFGEPADPTKTDPRVVDADTVLAIISRFVSLSSSLELDTARLYNGGNTEILLGKLLPTLEKDGRRVEISSKCYPMPSEGKSLSRLQVHAQIEDTLAALGVKQLDIFYLHWPDRSVPIEETLGAVHELYEQGKFRRFGLSNYAAWEVAEIVGVCKAKGYVLPVVYQGMYCAINRNVETELLPCLAHFNIAFYAYNPLAGGLLTGKYRLEEDPKTGRFAGDTLWGQAYRRRYWNPDVFSGLERLQTHCDATGITMVEASLRWLANHSHLGRRDAIIIGASSLLHIETNVAALQIREPLPSEILEAFEDLWFISKARAQNYWR